MSKRRSKDVSAGARVMTVALGAVQLTLAATAWADLAKRPSEQVRGPKAVWAVVIAVNFVGPITYFAKGRHPA
ncbi:PLD nuclease N-terminal domain-containing protein [Georgenia sunbinii]|uniref:PLD nuclease N-terminal domain-containing protein n=1 Tax=Georgenia sunbinii TaxID=3117728 RepID=UPI002F26A4DD